MVRNRMKKKANISKNYLERIPIKREGLEWSQDEQGAVTLSVENTGFFNKVAQKLFKKPPITYVHLDENGSFVWSIIDGKKDIIRLGEEVKAKFGDAAEPLYPRLAKFFQILDSYGFVEWK